MSIIFKGAIAHGILNKNPLDIVFHQKHTHGKALSKQEELTLLKATENTDYQLMFAIALYTGMRPNEYCTAKIDNGFIVCKNSKRKNGKFELKKIPITPMLKPYLTNATQLNFYPLDKLRKKFNSILSNHILYDLRTTFYSRCDECGVSDVAKKLFVGHSLGELGNAYTDLSDEYLLKEGDKIQLVGFGTFEIKDVPAKTGINPLTQEKVDIPASKKPSLKFGNSYKEKFN